MIQARVESQSDPKVPGRTTYRITASTREAVQSAISGIINDPNRIEAKFIGPLYVGSSEYGALGYKIARVYTV